jgi:hypothetical protein
MTTRKDKIKIKLNRTPAYVSRETGAAELEISPDTWDGMVDQGLLPKPVQVGIAGTTPRWCWADVVRQLSGKDETEESEPFFRGSDNG